MSSLESELRHALLATGEPEERTTVVAPLVAKAIQTLPIESFKLHYVAAAGLISPEYSFGPTKHSIDNAASPIITSEGIDGSFLSRGKLLRLAQAVWFGEFFVPKIWHDPEFRKNLALSTKHLDTVEELIWMGGFWHTSIDHDSVVSAHKMSGKTKDVDWRFQCVLADLRKWLNMEVKRRNSDLEQLCPGGEELSKPFADISQKFTNSSDDEINVAAITLYGSDPEQIAARADKWLRQNTVVDCVVLWNEVTATVASTALDSKRHKLEWLRKFMDAPIPAGQVPMLIRHPIDISRLL
jgi:hypothetical protein